MDLNIELNSSRAERNPKRTKAIACASMVLAVAGYAWDKAATQNLVATKAAQVTNPVLKLAEALESKTKKIKDLNKASTTICSQDKELVTNVLGKCVFAIYKELEPLQVPAEVFEEASRKKWSDAHDKLVEALDGFTDSDASTPAFGTYATPNGIWSISSSDTCDPSGVYQTDTHEACSAKLAEKVKELKAIAKEDIVVTDVKKSCSNASETKTFAYAIATCENKEAAECKTALKDILSTKEAKMLHRLGGDLKLVTEAHKPEVEKCLGKLGASAKKMTWEASEKDTQDKLGVITKNGSSGPSMTMVWIGLGVVAVLLAGVGVYMYLAKKKASGATAQADAAEA